MKLRKQGCVGIYTSCATDSSLSKGTWHPHAHVSIELSEEQTLLRSPDPVRPKLSHDRVDILSFSFRIALTGFSSGEVGTPKFRSFR
jgi:hypothetical protein